MHRDGSLTPETIDSFGRNGFLFPVRVANAERVAGWRRSRRWRIGGGSHLAGQVAYHDTFGNDNLLSRGQEVAVDVDPDELIDVELNAGEMSLHHGHMFHGSGPNTTDDRRMALVFRFMSPDVRQTVGSEDDAMTVRGANRSHHLHSTAAPAENFDPASLALHALVSAAQDAALADGASGELSYGR